MDRVVALSLALVCGACSGIPAEDVRLSVAFACESDRTATERIDLRVLRGGCTSSVVSYQATLSRTEDAPEQTIAPGVYGVEATAWGVDGALATSCREQRLPGAPLELVLSSAQCALELDASAGMGGDEVCGLGEPDDCVCWEKTHALHTYWFCREALDWPAARALCRMHQLDLVIIDDEEENAFVTREVRGTSHWIGANDRGSNGIPPISSACADLCSKSGDEGTWTWVEPISGQEKGVTFCEASAGSSECTATDGRYMNWGSGQPSNGGNECTPFLRCDTGEDCALLTGNQGTWQDAACSSKLRFVCESY